ncbi:MAG: DUF4184 family protein [Acidobacteria bacterium]|nr:DUF4184 family protein [Acidobacteriota bacterium]
MPFTFCHPAIVIPVARRSNWLSPLVIGSMSPDFLYFLNFSTGHPFGHTFPGIFLFCIPASLAVLWVYHRWLRQSVFALLPFGLSGGLEHEPNDFSFAPLPRLLQIIVLIGVGAASHIIWDAFTHQHGWGVAAFPVLRTALVEAPWETIRVYKVLQHLSTLSGASCLLYWYYQWFNQRRIQTRDAYVPEQNFRKLLTLGVIFALAFLSGVYLAFWKHPDFLMSWKTVNPALSTVIVSTITFGFGWLVVYSVLRHTLRR